MSLARLLVLLALKEGMTCWGWRVTLLPSAACVHTRHYWTVQTARLGVGVCEEGLWLWPQGTPSPPSL